MKPLPLLLLCSCAFHPSVDTSKWADTQTAISEGRESCDSLEQFTPLYVAQKAIGPTNLTVRNDLISAMCGLKALYHNGYSREGASYNDYIRVVFDSLKFPTVDYSHIVAPDSTIPIPETREFPHMKPSTDTFYMDSAYLVRQWGNWWILICINTHPGPKYNLHAKADFGAYSLYNIAKGKWEHRIAKYEGFKLHGEGDGLGLPWDVSMWRVMDKPRAVLRADMWSVVLTYGLDTLSFGFGDTLTVTYNKERR